MDFALILSLIALAASVFAVLKQQAFAKKFAALVADSTGQSLEKTLEDTLAKLASTKDELNEIKRAIINHERRIGKSLSNVAVLRYNPFQDTGGDLSFVIALLDENKNGLVFSSIHSREGTRVYAKPVKDAKSKYNLSVEETSAIEAAIKKTEP